MENLVTVLDIASMINLVTLIIAMINLVTSTHLVIFLNPYIVT